MSDVRAIPDPWASLQALTAARIALGRAGGSLPTKELLKFSYDHAQARDAVNAELDVESVTADLARLNLSVISVETRVTDRLTYLNRPDLGAQLNESSQNELNSIGQAHSDGFDISLIVADGLSATAVQAHAASLLSELIPLLKKANYLLAPIVVARQARVALQDEVGVSLRARASVILIGERPGLAAPDSLGAYLVFNPRPGNTNANRNCVSNIRPAGLPPVAAADALFYLITESLRRRISGVELKDERQFPQLYNHSNTIVNHSYQ